MATIAETPGDILIQNTPTTAVTIRRVEPNHAERILGVRMSVTAQMKTEYTYRLSQSQDLAARIKKAPLSRIEAEAAYRHWIPVASYCLPITTFTDKQTAKLMSPIYQALLPSLGYNRHTPHAAIFGPLRYGGAARHHLGNDQGTQHIRRLMGHLRQDDDIAKLFIIELNLLQLYAGCGVQILTANPNAYPYVPHTRLTYLWKFLHQIQATIHVSDAWTPPLIREGDSYLMAQFQSRNFKPKTMHILNKCRMFLNVITVADITNPHGTHIIKDTLVGKKHRTSHLKWPNCPTPTPQDWAIWKASLQRSLMLHATNVQYPLGKRMQTYHHQYTPAPPIQHFDFSLLPTQRYLRVIKDMLPPKYNQILGNISIPRDDGKAIMQDILLGTVLAGSDGSVKDSRATCGYVIMPKTKHKWVRGHGYVLGTPSLLTSLRAEHHGSMAVLLLLHMLSKRWNIPHGTPPVTILVDNKEVIDRMTSGLPGLSIKNHLVPDYDLWAEAIALVNTLPFPVHWKWVKAHQDTQKLDDLLVFGPLTANATINVLCDKLATSAYAITPPHSLNPHHMHASKVSITIHNQRVHTNMNHIIAHAYHMPKLRDYILERTGWTTDIFNSVDWDVTELYMKSLPDTTRTNAVKFIHDWQNTGKQNQQFQEAEDEKHDAHKQYTDVHTLCPYKCGMLETPLHYLHCISTNATQATGVLIQDIKTILQQEHTAMPIYQAIVTHLIATLSNTPPPAHITPTTLTPLDTIIHDAVRAQDAIGWSHFLKGRISTHWSKAQDAYYTQRTDIDRRKYTILRWKKRLLHAVIGGCIKCWDKRNTELHGDQAPVCAHIRLQKLRVRVAKAYANDKLLVPTKLGSLFHTPLKTRLQHRAVQLQKWLDTIRVAKQNHTLITVTNQIKIAYNFGRTKITNLHAHLFGITLREQLRTSIQTQIKWLSNYNIAITQSASTLHHYFQQPGRPPGIVIHRDLCP